MAHFPFSLFGSNMHAYGNGMSMTGSQIQQQQQQQQQQGGQQQQQQNPNQVNSSKLSSGSGSPSGGYSSYFGSTLPNGGSEMCRPVH